jgi:hypothetical protein
MLALAIWGFPRRRQELGSRRSYGDSRQERIGPRSAGSVEGKQSGRLAGGA